MGDQIMANLGLQIVSEDGTVKAQADGGQEAVLVYLEEYVSGDQIVFTVPQVDSYYVVQVDDTMAEELVYITKPEVVFTIPFGEKRISYNPKSFSQAPHYLTVRFARDYEIHAYRNLARNCMDQHGDPGCYPHTHANVETRGEAVFAARNAIDGIVANRSHGAWPYESWGINRQDDAEITLEFGHPVDFDTIRLYTRADFPHDNWWVKATFLFSDGSTETVSMEKSYDAHTFPIKKTGITWIKLGQLIKADDPSPFPALSQIEVYGTPSK